MGPTGGIDPERAAGGGPDGPYGLPAAIIGVEWGIPSPGGTGIPIEEGGIYVIV